MRRGLTLADPAYIRNRAPVTVNLNPTIDHYLDSRDQTYSNARAGTGSSLLLDSAGGTILVIGQALVAVTEDRCYETFIGFDTSSIPDDAVVTAATISFWPTTLSATTSFTAEVYAFDFGATVTTADWVPGANIGAMTLLASLASASLTTGAQRVFTSTGDFAAAINKTGDTRLLVCTDRLRNGNNPANSQNAFFAPGEDATVAMRPVLSVTYS